MKCICGGKISTRNTFSIDESGKIDVDYPVYIIRYRKCEKCGHVFKTTENVAAIREFFKICVLQGHKNPFLSQK